MLLWLFLQDWVFCIKTCSRMALMSNTCMHTLGAASPFLWSKHDKQKFMVGAWIR